MHLPSLDTDSVLKCTLHHPLSLLHTTTFQAQSPQGKLTGSELPPYALSFPSLVVTEQGSSTLHWACHRSVYCKGKLAHTDHKVDTSCITPWCDSTQLATGGLVCYCVHLQTDKAQTDWNVHLDKHSFHIFLQLKHTPFPLSLAPCNPTYTQPTPTSPVTSHLPDQGQLSRPAALDVKALTQHGHLCLSREINTRQGQRNWSSMWLHVIPAALSVSTLTSHSVSDNSSRLQTGDQEELQIEYVWQADLWRLMGDVSERKQTVSVHIVSLRLHT